MQLISKLAGTVLLLGSFYVSGQSVTTINIKSSADALVDNQNVSINYGTNSILESGVKISGVTTVRRTFLHYSLSAIPTDAIVVSAKIKLKILNEGTDVTNSSFVTQRANSNWNESGLSGITWTNQPTGNTGDPVSTSSFDGTNSYRVIDVTNHVSKMVNSMIPNYGWVIKRNNEISPATLGSTYRSNNDANTANHPILEIQYYRPFAVTAASITHCSADNSSDGNIATTVNYGPSSPNYQWLDSNGLAISGATTSTLSNQPSGWYGLRITGSQGNPVYMAFVIGVKCKKIAFTFNPGPNYINDAYTKNLSINVNTNFGNSNDFLTEEATFYDIKSQLKFNLWVDPSFTVPKAELKLIGLNHNISNRTNESYLKKITSPWQENTICWYNLPSYTNTNQISISTTTVEHVNKTIPTQGFWTDWKNNNTTNYGYFFELQTFNNINATMSFCSSDHATSSNYPKIDFEFDLSALGICPQSLSDFSYARLKTELDGGYATTFQGQVKIRFDEEEDITSGKKIPFILYSEQNVIKGSCDITGTTTGGATPMNYNFDDNSATFNLSSITGVILGSYYILEVTTTNGTKKKLRIYYKN